MKSDIPGYLWNNSSQTLFWSNALRFCASTFSCLEDFLENIFSILVYLQGNYCLLQSRNLSDVDFDLKSRALRAAQNSKAKNLFIMMKSLYQIWHRGYKKSQNVPLYLQISWGSRKILEHQNQKLFN